MMLNHLKKLKLTMLREKTVNKSSIKIADVCTILEKCSIDEISKFLVEQGKNREFPDITTRNINEKNRLNIAIVGLGNIGSYLYKYLNKNKNILTKKNNCAPVVKYVSAKSISKKRSIKISKNKWLKSFSEAPKKKILILLLN